MSSPVNLQALPAGVFDTVFTPETVRGRTSMNSLSPLSFPKSRSALWDGSPAGQKLRLHLCAHRKPRLVLLEKALRLAQRHARHSNKPRLLCFLLGSVCVDADEQGLTVTLDRFDPGRDQDQAGDSGRVPSALLPGDVLVPCLISAQTETDAVIQSEAELHHCFKVLYQCVSSRQPLDLCQLIRVRGHVTVSQQCDAAAFVLNWSAVCPSVSVDVQPVRAIPIIPTALLRSLTSINRPAPLHAAHRQRGFLTMDQTRKLLLLLESDPKASNLPLVGLWMSGVTHVSNPQVWAWCLRFLYGSALQDRVLSESGWFLLVLFGSTHRAPQFFQCRGPGPQLDYQLLTASHSVTLYQVVSVEGQALQVQLGSEDRSRQVEVFREAQTSFSRAAGLSVGDQDSGVEDEDLSPRPSPSPHPPAQQARRVQPSVPELSLLIDSSFSCSGWQDPGSAHRPPPPAPSAAATDRKSAPPTGNSSSSSAPKPAAPPHLHSTPNSNMQQPCSCCSSSHSYSCTSIFSSPAFPPAVTPPLPHPNAPTSHHRHTPPPAPPSSHHQTPPSSNRPTSPAPAPSTHSATLSSHHQGPSPSSLHPTPPAHSHHHPPPHSAPPARFSAPPLSSHHYTPPSTPSPSSHHHNSPSSKNPPPPSAPPSSHSTSFPPPSTRLSAAAVAAAAPPPPPSSHHYTPPFKNHTPLSSASPSSHSTSFPPPSTPLSAPPPPAPWCGDSPSPMCPPWFSHQCCAQMGGDTYQLLLQQDQQLRLLQAQVQMLLEAQGKLQSSGQQVETQTQTSTASIAVGTGASLFWGDPVQFPLPHQEVQAPLPSSPRPSSHTDLPVIRPVGGAEDGDITGQEAASPSSGHHSVSGLQSPVLGESVSMYRPEDEQQSFYHNLMTQLTSRLQESDSKQEVEEKEEEDESRSRRSLSDRSQSSQSSQSTQSTTSSRERKQYFKGDPVLSATVRQLQQLGVDVDQENLTESDRRVHQTVEISSTLASINPAAVLSRLSVSDPTVSSLFPGDSVDLSLEANAIALRYLSDSQLSRLSLGGHTPRTLPPSSSNNSLMSPSNMSLATRKYMRKYGLIEEEEEEEEEEVNVQEVLAPQPLTKTLNVKLLPQSQLIRDLRPKMQQLAGSNKSNSVDKENCPSRRPSLVRANSLQTEGSVGNILDLSRLRQLPKLF